MLCKTQKAMFRKWLVSR